MTRATRLACVTLMLCAASCRSHLAPAEPADTVTHVVLCWLKAPGDERVRRKMIETSRTFETIPGVVRVSSGRPLPSTRPIVDSSFDVAIVITFRDEAALRAYDGHPTHKKAVAEVLRPLAGKIVIYDFVGE